MPMRRVFANVRMVIVRQVEFDVSENASDDEMESIALSIARTEWGEFDEGEIEEMDWADNPIIPCKNCGDDRCGKASLIYGGEIFCNQTCFEEWKRGS